MTVNIDNFSFYILGHAFRRTSTAILANTGANIETIKRHGGWKSASVAEQYIEDSLHYKRKTGDTLLSSISGNCPKGTIILQIPNKFFEKILSKKECFVAVPRTVSVPKCDSNSVQMGNFSAVGKENEGLGEICNDNLQVCDSSGNPLAVRELNRDLVEVCSPGKENHSLNLHSTHNSVFEVREMCYEPNNASSSRGPANFNLSGCTNVTIQYYQK